MANTIAVEALAFQLERLLSLQNQDQSSALQQIRGYPLAKPEIGGDGGISPDAARRLAAPSIVPQPPSRHSDSRSACLSPPVSPSRANKVWMNSMASTTSTGTGCSTSDLGSDAEGEWANISTVKIENLPRRCSQDEVLTAVDAAGFSGSYDFFFMPRGPCSKQNHGHAFLNFKDPAIAIRFRDVMIGSNIRAKRVHITQAPIQGLARNVERFWRASGHNH
jgi:hypothetical protein